MTGNDTTRTGMDVGTQLVMLLDDKFGVADVKVVARSAGVLYRDDIRCCFRASISLRAKRT